MHKPTNCPRDQGNLSLSWTDRARQADRTRTICVAKYLSLGRNFWVNSGAGRVKKADFDQTGCFSRGMLGLNA